jgi:phage FluMu protein Com
MKVVFKNSPPAAPCPCHDSCPELRCECGALVARLAGARVELKCRRCKRVTYLDLEQLRRGGWVAT